MKNSSVAPGAFLQHFHKSPTTPRCCRPHNHFVRRNRNIYFGALLLIGAVAPVAIRPLPVNPLVDPGKTIHSQMSVPAGVDATLRRACYSCHSNETDWPWYSRVPLAGDAVRNDVRRARATMNFSEWVDQAGKTPRRAAGTLRAGCSAIRSGRMPKKEYLWMHPEARLDPAEIRQFCQWTESLTIAARQSR